MCGISGFIGGRQFLNENAIKNTLNLMKLRGPDSRNFIIKEYSSKKVALLHSRLNIIDLDSRSNQPFVDGNLTIIFNGEIYNYLEIKKKLEYKYKFRTNSDTEVLLKAFQEYGENCVNHFVGMWAFAIWDDKNKTLFLSRDPFGEKPLYYFLNHKGFFFGSEIKFIKSLCGEHFTKNQSLIKKFLFLGYKSIYKKNETFYNNIFYLENSTNLKINLNLNFKKKRYWFPKIQINKNLTKKDAIDGVRHYLEQSLKLRLRSDVPIAFCLSGGVDSSALASIASKKFNQNISTFSIIDDDERYNELQNIKIINSDLKCKYNLINLESFKKKENFLDRMKKLVKQHDGPISTISYFIHSFLSEAISKKGFKVAISGTGADEMFTGYYDHYLYHLATLNKSKFFNYRLNDWKQFVLPNIRNENLRDPYIYIKNQFDRRNVFESNFNLNQYSLTDNNFNFKEKNFCKELLRNRMVNELFYEVVPIILNHDDLNSMFNSIENRSPYLDRDLFEFSTTIPPEYLIEDGYQKKVLRDATVGILDDQIRLDRKKKGFNASISSIMNLESKENLDFFLHDNSQIAEFVDIKKFKKDLNIKFIPNHLSKFIFSMIGVNMFLEN